jgi:hypothetical protein
VRPIILLWAAEFRQANIFARKIGLRGDMWHFLDDPRKLMGLDRFVVIRCGARPLGGNADRIDEFLADRAKMERCTILWMHDL